jgi:hypothetical protein
MFSILFSQNIWASRFVALTRFLASGYPLHHLRTHCFAVSRFGGSAAIPLAKNAKKRQ